MFYLDNSSNTFLLPSVNVSFILSRYVHMLLSSTTPDVRALWHIHISSKTTGEGVTEKDIRETDEKKSKPKILTAGLSGYNKEGRRKSIHIPTIR